MSDHRRHIVTPTGYLMVLRQGDDVLARLEALMLAEDIASASISGFGFVAKASFGFFDFERGEYSPHELEELEITSLTGSLAWKGGEPSVHAHASGGDREFRMSGGHVLGLIVGRGSFEITVTAHPQPLERKLDQAVGANILQLG